ncbi:MAG: hypothetical protein ACI94Y_002688 [Maribacter sp.]|jgi:hypothetical protein
MGIASNDHCYVWYKDGTASSGNSGDLDTHRTPYKYSGGDKTGPALGQEIPVKQNQNQQ